MLQIKNIQKQYVTGDLVQKALDDVSLTLRDNEFVAILGPSGSGKTTLLNIIGGLDRYDSGDLIINGISTKKYKDRDWDSYRNHTIGFVFQSYNLIPHQSVLSNVELALTISGVSKSERTKRAKQALEKVGLGNQLHKKPNQMSGGQMQRVAIARALVNDPDILLADEPTGALDSETSIQVMELLKKVAKDRLVVMVTHNPELAEQYASRIVKLKDGVINDDTNPYTPKENEIEHTQHKNMGKSSMSFLMAMSLSFNNLRTKKGRTILTAFAGSIGIIGIALIFSLSTGVNNYISDIQKDTMTSYPITINDEAVDMSGMMSMRGSMMGGKKDNEGSKELDGVYADNSEIEANNMSIAENDLTAFKKYLDDPNSDIQQYIGENGIDYSYDVNFDAYSYDSNNNLINTNVDIDDISDSNSSSNFATMPESQMPGDMSSMLTGSSSSGADNFEELIAGTNGNTISQVVTDSYDLLYGDWASKYNEVVLVLDENNAIPTGVLYQLGLITSDEYNEVTEEIANDEEPETLNWDYSDICGHSFYIVPACDSYIKNDDGKFTYIGDNSFYSNEMLENSIDLKVVGVIKPIDDAKNATISSAVAYTSALTDYIIDYTNKSEIVLAQSADKSINVLNGMSFEAMDDATKISDAKDYLSNLNVSDKASMYTMIMYYSSSNSDTTTATSDATQGMPQGNGDAAQQSVSAVMDEGTMAAALDKWILETPDNEILLSIYDDYISGESYEDNMTAFGVVSYDTPSSISIYADSFDDKDAVADCIAAYNKTVDEDSQITYTDFVALITSSITSIIDVITYVLIAFVSVSLVVSCIMIGIITHISVIERTKEIGILRALGASKSNISQVFNAETIIIGLCAGLIGVILTMLLTIPINALIGALIGTGTVKASLPISYAAILVIISMVITVIGGLLPAKKAAKKDPVTALRTE